MAAETRVWLIERSYGTDEDLVTLVYATPDGTRQLKKQLPHRLLHGTEITAAREVPDGRLEAVPEDEQERYATEAGRTAKNHDPGEIV